jgi:hypothetical protein
MEKQPSRSGNIHSWTRPDYQPSDPAGKGACQPTLATVDTIMLRIKYTPPPHLEPIRRSTVKPLTHHEILSLVSPFAAQDVHVDLQASDRGERLLAFKPIAYECDDPERSQVLARLYLENPEPGRFRLIRMLHHPAGAEASLYIDGDDPGAMLEQVQAVDPGRQLQARSGVPIARSYRLRMEKSAASPAPELTRAEALVGAIRLTLNARTGRGMPVELELSADDDNLPYLPQDLLAVLGWDWRPLRRIGRRWRGTLRVARDEPVRTDDAEAKLAQTVDHLVQTLALPPSRYHARFSRQRWMVAFRRALPLLSGLAVLAATPLIQLLDMGDRSLLRLIIFHAPPLLMVGMFMLKEMPNFEIPPLPRRLRDDAWVPLDGVPKTGCKDPTAAEPPPGSRLSSRRRATAIRRFLSPVGEQVGRGLRALRTVQQQRKHKANT